MSHTAADVALTQSASDPGKGEGRSRDVVASARRLLKLAVLIHAASLFAMVFMRELTAFHSFLFDPFFHTWIPVDDPDAATRTLENVTVSVLLILAVAVVFHGLRTRWYAYVLLAVGAGAGMFLWPAGPQIEAGGASIAYVWLLALLGTALAMWLPITLLLVAIAGYAFVEAWSRFYLLGSGAYDQWAIPAEALRWGAPLVLCALVWFTHRRASAGEAEASQRRRVGKGVLMRSIAAALLLIYALLAWWGHAPGADVLAGGLAGALGVALLEPAGMVNAVAIVALVLGLVVVLYPRPLMMQPDHWPRFCALVDRWRVPIAALLLRVMVAVVFVTHGLMAWWGDPRFVDLLLGSFSRVLDVQMSNAEALMLMKVIAVVDFCVAAAVLIYPRPILFPPPLWSMPCKICAIRRVILPVLLIWMAFWGFLTALARMTSLGYPSGLYMYPELLARASHYLGPLALWCLFIAMYTRRTCQVKSLRVAKQPKPIDQEPAPTPVSVEQAEPTA